MTDMYNNRRWTTFFRPEISTLTPASVEPQGADSKSFDVGAKVKRCRTLVTQLAAPVAAICMALLLPDTSAAQSRFFPDVPSFEFPTASPRIAGLAGRILMASIGDNQFGAEREADAAIGEDFPILALRLGEKPISVGFNVEVFGRFSLEDSKSSLISNDWTVGFNTLLDLRPWEIDVQIYHESSHLGDEYATIFLARRLDWTREILATWVGYRAGSFRVLGGINRVLIDELHLQPWGVNLGVDYQGGAAHLAHQSVHLIAGVYSEGWAASSWLMSNSAKLGLAIPGAAAGKDLQFSIIAHDGLSTQRQFFRARSRYVGVEVEFQL